MDILLRQARSYVMLARSLKRSGYYYRHYIVSASHCLKLYREERQAYLDDETKTITIEFMRPLGVL